MAHGGKLLLLNGELQLYKNDGDTAIKTGFIASYDNQEFTKDKLR